MLCRINRVPFIVHEDAHGGGRDVRDDRHLAGEFLIFLTDGDSHETAGLVTFFFLNKKFINKRRAVQSTSELEQTVIGRADKPRNDGRFGRAGVT